MGRRHRADRSELPIIVEGGGAEPSDRRDAEPVDSAPSPVRRADVQVLAASAVVALVIVASIVVVTDSDSPERATTSTRAPVLSPIAAPESDVAAADTRATAPLLRTRTVVGTINWTRHDGGSDLPARVDVDTEGGLVGIDGESRPLRPIDGASRWVPMETVERSILGGIWRQRRVGGALGLGIVTPIGWDVIELTDLLDAPPAGFEATVEPVLGLTDGFPVDLDGELFLLASTRVGLPWDEIADLASDGSYRAELSDGERSIGLARGRFNELPIEKFSLIQGVGASHHVTDVAGNPVWSFEVDVGRRAVEEAAGRFETSWLRWNGSRFLAIERPWPDWHDVDMVRVGEGVLARSHGPLHSDVALWHSDDGHAWTRVELPAERTERTPVTVHRDHDGAIVTMFAGGGFQAWATSDGTAFDRLADVPGIAERRRGDFGWVAADPRSAPTLRLSADGELWQEVDIAPLLDLDASRWDVTITAVADQDRIVVVVDRPEGRSVLVGDVLSGGSG